MEHGCWAIANLSLNDDNVALLVQAGACEVLVAALTTFCQVGCKNLQSDVAEQGCYAVANACYDPATALKMGKSGGCQAVVQVLRAFPESPSVLAEAFGALRNLALGDDANVKVLGEVGGCEVVVNVMRRFEESVEMVVDCCWVVSILAQHPANRRLLGALGACEAVTEGLRTFHGSTAGGNVIVRTGMAVTALAAETPENREKFANRGVSALLHAVLGGTRPLAPRAKESAEDALRSLSE